MFNFKQLTLISLALTFGSQAFAQESPATNAPIEEPVSTPIAPENPVVPTLPKKTMKQSVSPPAPKAVEPPSKKPAKPAVAIKKSKLHHKKKPASSLAQAKSTQEWDNDYTDYNYVTVCDQEQTLGVLNNPDKVYVSTAPTTQDTGIIQSKKLEPIKQDTYTEVKPMTHESKMNFDNHGVSNKAHAHHRAEGLVEPTVYVLLFAEGEIELNEENKMTVVNVTTELMNRPDTIARINSLGYVCSGSAADSRRASLQRALKVRKLLIENDINPNNISVNATEDLECRCNEIEIRVEHIQTQAAGSMSNA